MRRRIIQLATFILFGVCCNAATLAADRALLIGVGDYGLPGASLPGIASDLEAMEALAISLGFDEKNIKVLADRQATLSAIRINFQRHLIHGVRPEDRVLLYFTGHGTQVPDRSGDESDGADETLLPFDARLRTRRGVTQLENVLLDDELDALLSAIPSDNVLVLVDACHSGTVTRALLDEAEEEGWRSKSFIYDGMPTPENGFTRSVPDPAETFNYVGLSAAADDQLAIATERGSVFTNALVETIDAAVGEPLTMGEIARRVSEKIKNSVEPDRVFTPQISGNKKNADKILLRASPANR